MHYLDKADLYETMTFNKLKQLGSQLVVANVTRSKYQHVLIKLINELRENYGKLEEALFIHDMIQEVDSKTINEVVKQTDNLAIKLYEADQLFDDMFSP